MLDELFMDRRIDSRDWQILEIRTFLQPSRARRPSRGPRPHYLHAIMFLYVFAVSYKKD